MNIHIHTDTLEHASRILKCLATAGRSGCFRARTFIGAGPESHYQLEDAQGNIQVAILRRQSDADSSFFRKVLTTQIWTRKVKSYAKKLPAKCINVHGLSTLPLGVALKRHHGCPLVYDTHELETKVTGSGVVRRLSSAFAERALIHHCDAVVCVSDGIADWYANHYRIKRPLVVRNVPDRRAQVAAKTVIDLRSRCGVPQDALLFLYQGVLRAGRQIERFMEVFARLSPDRHVVFMGPGELQDAIRTASGNHGNIHFCPPVPPNEVLAYTVQADIGLVGMENGCLNHRLALPNKFFEYLTAGLPVVIPDLPEMQRVVDRYQCGWSWSGGTEGLAALLGRLTLGEVKVKRERALAARSELSWEMEEQKLFELYRKLLEREPAGALS